MQLSVVILNYNVEYFLELCLQSVFAAIKNIDAEVIVADNNSQDGSCAMIRKKFPRVVLIENKSNIGFAKANNQAVKIAKGECICILNPDTVVTEDTFENCLNKALLLDDLGMIGVQLLDGKGRFLPESKRNLPTPKVALFKLFGKRFSFLAPYYAEHINENENKEVSILVGAFMFCKKETYVEVRGFDERYFMYGEDIDISYTMQLKGKKNYYLGENKVIHFKGESSFENEKYRERFFGAMKLFYNKHFKSSWLGNNLVFFGIKMASMFCNSKNNFNKKDFSFFFVLGNNGLVSNGALKTEFQKISENDLLKYKNTEDLVLCVLAVSYTHLTLPTIYSV